MTNPIRPSEVVSHKATVIPDKVIEIFNRLIAFNFSSGSARIKQSDIVSALFNAGFAKEHIFADKLLDVEDIYRAAGWRVEYDKPGFNEPGDAVFIFSVPSSER